MLLRLFIKEHLKNLENQQRYGSFNPEPAFFGKRKPARVQLSWSQQEAEEHCSNARRAVTRQSTPSGEFRKPKQAHFPWAVREKLKRKSEIAFSPLPLDKAEKLTPEIQI